MRYLFFLLIRIYWSATHKIRSLFWSFILDAKKISIGKNARIIGYKYVNISEDVHIGRFSLIQAIDGYHNQKFNPVLNIGKGVKTSDFIHVGCTQRIDIGDNCLIASKVLIIDHEHGMTSYENLSIAPVMRDLYSSPIKIGKNVFLGDNVVVLPGADIGDNSIIGANSVVKGVIPSFSVAVGSPAKVIKKITKK